MAFLINQTHTNDYRCSCCMQLEDVAPVWVDTEAEAKAAWDRFFVSENNDYSEPYSITITDGSTGVEIAQARKHWGATRQDRYKKTWFTGHWRGTPLEGATDGTEA